MSWTLKKKSVKKQNLMELASLHVPVHGFKALLLIMCLYLSPKNANHDCSRQHSEILFHCFSEKIRLDVSSESSARQWIHLKHQALFSLKDKSEKLKCRLLQFLFGALRVNIVYSIRRSFASAFCSELNCS